MPFYEYQCESCGHHLEALQKITDKPLKKCPECGKPRLKRLMSAPVFRLKGSGWYETDFKSDGEAKRNLAGEKEPTESKGEATSDTKAADKPADKAADKPAAKAEPKPAAKPKLAAKAPAKKAQAKAARKPAPRKAAGRKR